MKAGKATRAERRYLIVSTVLAGLWLVFAWIVAPWIIRRAYAEESLPFLNDILEGRASHPVDRYLDAWGDLAVGSSLALVVVAVLGFLFLRYWTQIKSAFDDRTWQPVTSRTAVIVAAWLGWWTGLSNAAYRLGVSEFGRPRQPHIEVLWMAPIVGAVIAGVLGWIAWSAARRTRGSQTRGGQTRSGQTLLPAAVVGVGFFFYSWLRLFGFTIHPLAALVLALGLASQLARPLVRWNRGFIQLVRRTSPWLAAATIGAAVTIVGSERLSERSAIRGLGAAPEGAKSVLLLILDTARAKSMSLYGAARPTTPNIDRLALGGTVFDAAIAPAPWTLPTHGTFFTGRLPEEHGASWVTPLGAEETTLAEVLSDAGYQTGGFVANEVFARRPSGLDQGFHRYQDSSLRWTRLPTSLPFIDEPITWLRKRFGHRGQLGRKDAAEVNEEFLDWLDGTAEPDRPFFAFLNYFDVHAPYRAPPPYDALFSPPGDRYWIGEWVRDPEIGADDLVEIETAYDEVMAYLDHQIGLLFEELDRRGRLENTLVVLTSDHGEQFGEHGMTDHGNSLYMPLLRVPLLLIDGDGAVPAGTRIRTPVSLRHLAGTILDLAGAPTRLPGESLAQHWSGEAASEPIRTDLTAQEPWWARRSLLADPLYYIRNFGGGVEEELYDLDRDPNELHNLAVEPLDEETEARLFRMRTLLDSLDVESAQRAEEVPTTTTRGSS